HQGNFINTLTGVIDSILARARPHHGEAAYADKAVKSDPFRNYAEDIAVALQRLFGAANESFHVTVVDRWVPASGMLDDQGLTALGRAVTKFFTHGIPVPGGEDAL